jgi:hypothetical protein
MPQLSRLQKLSVLLAAATAISLLLPSPAHAATQVHTCPPSISERSVRLADTPQGWTPYVGSPLYLHGATPMNGPPINLGELSDFTQKRGKNAWTYTYQLNGKFPDGKWLACTYGESDQLTLSRRLDDGVQACTFTYRKGKYAGQNEIAIRCTGK